MVNGKRETCGICGRREESVKMTLYSLPVPTGDCYVLRQERLCAECREFVQEWTKVKIIELGEEIDKRRVQNRKTRGRK